ncbi:PQQ-dependent sugar dehydrogenase [Planktomarina sp.]|nr:PQQ-dependent sugar dehydrogenase [Planktomarina sp.]
MRAIVLIILFGLTTKSYANNLITGSVGGRIQGDVISEFQDPWAMSFIDKENLLVTTKAGKLWILNSKGKKSEVSGVPSVFEGGQGGLGDIVKHPNYDTNKLVYISFITSKDNGKTRFATIMRANLDLLDKPILRNIETIWDQSPAESGKGHFSHRITFGLENSEHAGKIFITSGDRQKQSPAQSMNSALGKIIRLNDDGSIPADNPFQNSGALAKTFWTLGHRNSLGIAFSNTGDLWAHEMGPRHGDELNLIKSGNNYGWPLVSEGNHYSGKNIPAHSEKPEFTAPQLAWVPTVAPSGLMFYKGNEFPQWADHAFIGGLKSRALVRINFQAGKPFEEERFSWNQRIREVELGPNGAIWVLEDGLSGRLIKFTRPN